ncbi:MAG: hypothetical protein H7Y09_11415 [Chitinophagaceae bacterium]|nr:hypothetical protein [Anaerolineae bacterium]
MNDPITPPPTPTTSKWLGYNQTVCLLIIGASCLVMLFFRADELLGAAGLGVVYKNIGFLAGCAILLVIPIWFAAAGIVTRVIAGGLGLFIIFGGIVIAPYHTLLAIILISIYLLMSTFFLITLIGSLYIVFWIIIWLWFKNKNLREEMIKFITVMTLLIASTVAITAGFSTNNWVSDYYGTVSLKDQRYFLYLRTLEHDSMTEDWLQLYECNSIGLGCRVVNSSLIISPSYRSYKKFEGEDIVMVAGPSQNEVRILFNDEVVFTHRPDDE